MTMRVLSTKAHGVLDYLMAGMLLALPWLLGWSAPLRLLLMVLALGMLTYSLFTRYELGAFRAIPMRAHLGLDIVGGLVLVAVALMMTYEPTGVRWTLGILGMAELGAALLTDPNRTTLPADNTAAMRRRSPGV